MATPAAQPAGGPPARTIAALAKMPAPRNDIEFNELTASAHYLCEILASVIDQAAAGAQRELAYGPKGGAVDRFRARRMARQACLPLFQAAERVRGGGSSAMAAWRRFNRIYAALLHPRSNERGFDFTAGQRRR